MAWIIFFGFLLTSNFVFRSDIIEVTDGEVFDEDSLRFFFDEIKEVNKKKEEIKKKERSPKKETEEEEHECHPPSNKRKNLHKNLLNKLEWIIFKNKLHCWIGNSIISTN